MEKKIMYDSPEAAKLVTVPVYELHGRNGIYVTDESIARYNNCTHKTCECGSSMSKGWLKCETCLAASRYEKYKKLPFKDYDSEDAVCTAGGDRYFFNEEDLVEYMEENEMTEIDLLICEENKWVTVGEDYWSDNMPTDGDGELPKEMQEALNRLNEIISNLPAQSYSPGKIRTNYSLTP